MRLAFDIETDGLVPELTKVHSLVIQNLDDGVLTSCADQPGFVPIEAGVKMLASAQMLAGHNIIGFDLPALRKVYPWFRFDGIAVDTLVLGRVVFPDVKNQIDFALQKKGKLPGHLMGRHALEAWGYRLGLFKGDYTDWCKENGIENPWLRWCGEMQDYCVQDVAVTVALLKRLLDRMAKQGWKSDAVSLEHDVQRIILRQIAHGFAFDTAAAQELHATLVSHKLGLEEKLQAAFPPRDIATPFVPKANNKKMGYVKGEVFIKRSVEVFNPSSRQMIAARLKSKYAWEPTEYTDSGQPKIDEGTLEGLEWPEAKLLNEYLMVEKRLAAVAEGKQAWLAKVGKDGRMHGNVNPMGAATSRMTHNGPNVGQVPSVDVPYGKECRALYIAKPGYVLVGCDADALELRCLAHRMAMYDGGAYVETVLKGDKSVGTDMHSVNARAIGLDPKKHYTVGALELPGREIAKTFFYAFIYGAGAEKLGTILGKVGRTAIITGAKIKARFLTGLPALGKLIAKLAEKTQQQGFIRGLDGRVIPLRSAHAALNTLLQSDGAILMKRALVILDASLASAGLHWGNDYEYVANVHDEWQIEVKEQYAKQVGQLAVEAIREAGRYYNYRCPLDGQYKVGKNWAQTH